MLRLGIYLKSRPAKDDIFRINTLKLIDGHFLKFTFTLLHINDTKIKIAFHWTFHLRQKMQNNFSHVEL